MNRSIIKLLAVKAFNLLRIRDPYQVYSPSLIRAQASPHRPREIRIRHDQFVVKR
jgi:hypothetical protein